MTPICCFPQKTQQRPQHQVSTVASGCNWGTRGLCQQDPKVNTTCLQRKRFPSAGHVAGDWGHQSWLSSRASLCLCSATSLFGPVLNCSKVTSSHLIDLFAKRLCKTAQFFHFLCHFQLTIIESQNHKMVWVGKGS